MPSIKFSKTKKLFLICASAILGAAAYFTALSYFESKMTPWQLEQKIDFDSQRGSTRFKAHVDSLSIGGAVFCASAILISVAVKVSGRKK